MNHLSDLLLPAVVGLVAMFLLRRHILHSRAGAEEARSSAVISTEAYGRELAEAVASRLERGDSLAYGHRDYCGTGLRFADGEFICGEVSDGELLTSKELKTWSDIPNKFEHITFSQRHEFIEWLAAQSDVSLHGADLRAPQLVGNQRLTLQRLESFAAGHQVPHVARSL